MTALPPHLAPTRTVDFDDPVVADFARRHAGGGSERERAVRLYYAVRDSIRYDPYAFLMDEADFRASQTLRSGSAWCVPKAILLAACCRQQGIPARLGFADVKNHLATERLLQLMDTDQFIWHGYVSMRIEGKWVKATPAFNIEMCRRFEVLPLEFDGTADSLMHPFNARAERHMEYVRDRGLYDDLPFAEMAADMRRVYPRLIALAESKVAAGKFDTDAIRREG
ncbi:MAG: transglutaminase family protein [Deltaproteobacteria bacterium]|nr:transglutaminase family protein [Deltaproteobacteria bacterium]